jgi:hypothetical protein
LWCAIILHARWGRMVKERGLMALALFGNIMTSFSWFGVNMLGVGLHAYGFMDKAFTWLSFRDRAAATKPPKTSPSSGRDPGLPAPAHA